MAFRLRDVLTWIIEGERDGRVGHVRDGPHAPAPACDFRSRTSAREDGASFTLVLAVGPSMKAEHKGRVGQPANRCVAAAPDSRIETFVLVGLAIIRHVGFRVGIIIVLDPVGVSTNL